MAITLASATALAPAAFAASSNTNAAAKADSGKVAANVQKGQTGNGQTSQATRDLTKLSKQGYQAFRDLRLARLAVFDGKTDQAGKLVSQAQDALQKAAKDETSFKKAASDIHMPQAMANQQAANGNAQKTGAGASTQPVEWLPIDAQVNLTKGYAVTPDNSKAVKQANAALQSGDKQGAVDTLKSAGIDVEYTMALAPLKATRDDVQQAAKDIDAKKYYEANLDLKQAEDGVVFDVVDIAGAPNAKVGANTSSGQQKTTQSAQNGAKTKASHRTTSD